MAEGKRRENLRGRGSRIRADLKRKEKKKEKTTIDGQFEYNQYIRDFFADNPGKSLQQAILCWKYKKALQGHNRYEKSDLAALGHTIP